MDRADVAVWIREARKSRGWSQDRLGDELGVTKGNVSHWETAKHDPSFGQLLRIRDVTGYPLRDVAQADNWPLPGVQREQITALDAQQRAQLERGINALLAALDPVAPTGNRTGTGG